MSDSPNWSLTANSRSLQAAALKCLFWHVSFPRTLLERRMVVFPQCNYVIKVISSVIFKVMIF